MINNIVQYNYCTILLTRGTLRLSNNRVLKKYEDLRVME